MSIHKELSRRSDELWDYWDKLGPMVNSTLDVERIARRELMARYIGQRKPEALLPLFDWVGSVEDLIEIDTVVDALAEKRKFNDACRVWEQHLARLEKEYWSGLKKFQRQYGPGSADEGDPDGQRVYLYERPRSLLIFAYDKYSNLINIHGGRSTEKLLNALRARRRQIFSEPQSGRPIVRDDRAMTDKVFWELIDSVGRAQKSTDDRVEALGDRLKGFQPKEIARFGKLLRLRLKEANTWSLWGAAYLLNGGSSDDGFLDFRGWLILQGQRRFVESVRDADSMARWARVKEDDPAECEELRYLADEVYEEVTGRDSPGAEVDDGNPKGKRWKEEELPARLPKLWKLTQK